MRILQFAFESGAGNPFLPHHYEPDTVVYTGTHDNNTAHGWWSTASSHERAFARAYLATDGGDIAWALIRAAWGSVADTAIAPMQDVLSLPASARMNFPGQGEGWWRWRFAWSQVQPWHAERLVEMGRLFGRPAPRRMGRGAPGKIPARLGSPAGCREASAGRAHGERRHGPCARVRQEDICADSLTQPSRWGGLYY